MDYMGLKSEDLYMEVVSSESASIFSSFTCGNEEIDRYFRDEAPFDESRVCYAYRNKKDRDVVGIAAICCSGINLGNEKAIQLEPAIKIDYFALSERYHHVLFPETEREERFYISDAFLCELIREIRRISLEYVGARYIVLYSVTDARNLYERNLFENFEQYMKPEQSLYLEGCHPMYMRL